MQKHFGTLSIEDQLTEMITGTTFKICIPKEIIGKRIPWMALEQPEVYTAYYENLVGPKGGGTKEAQIDELTGISEFLNLKLSKRVIRAIADAIYGKPGEHTFNTGKIGNWKFYFNELQKDAFKEAFGDELIFLGYENDANW
jgi:hypothetical protein